jgi:hypothetical protein
MVAAPKAVYTAPSQFDPTPRAAGQRPKMIPDTFELLVVKAQ